MPRYITYILFLHISLFSRYIIIFTLVLVLVFCTVINFPLMGFDPGVAVIGFNLTDALDRTATVTPYCTICFVGKSEQ